MFDQAMLDLPDRPVDPVPAPKEGLRVSEPFGANPEEVAPIKVVLGRVVLKRRIKGRIPL